MFINKFIDVVKIFYPNSGNNAALNRDTQIAGPKAMQAGDIGVQWPRLVPLRRRRPGHEPDRGNAALATTQLLPTSYSKVFSINFSSLRPPRGETTPATCLFWLAYGLPNPLRFIVTHYK